MHMSEGEHSRQKGEQEPGLSPGVKITGSQSVKESQEPVH